ncbi:XdhC family protein [Leptothermofonsia sp. ETS-13]|uniref:XdhC family protein n=1 Tax=Leptothermofonsia sp. ETS-13 TaxID=3035696 RepID=UPI003BA07DFA
MLEFYQQMVCALRQGPIVLATVIHAKGSVPREVGAKMVVCSDGTIIGTIGGGAGEAKVIDQAHQVLVTGKKHLTEIDLSGAPQRETQGICGGVMQVWLERWQGEPALALVSQIVECLELGQTAVLVMPFEDSRSPYLELSPPPTPYFPLPPSYTEPLIPPPTLLIVGAGHCAVSLAQIAHIAGFRVIVQDDRPQFANRQRFPDASCILAKPIAEALQSLPEIAQLYVALVTRGLTYDLEALQILMGRSTQYIGMIGSEKRVRTVFHTLQQSIGALQATNLLQQIHAPIGLDIGALTPAEIAISICAELIKVRRGGTGRSLSERIHLPKQSANGSSTPSIPSEYAQ